MTSTSSYVIGAAWPPQEADFQALVEQHLQLFERLERIDPVLATLSPTGLNDGFTSMTAQPTVEDIPTSTWIEMFERSMAANGYVSTTFWNKKTDQTEFFELTVVANQPVAAAQGVSRANLGRFCNGISMPRIPKSLTTAKKLEQLLGAVIQSFPVEEGEIYRYEPDLRLRFQQWLVWTSEPREWPFEILTKRLSPEQDCYDKNEAFLRGIAHYWERNCPGL